MLSGDSTWCLLTGHGMNALGVNDTAPTFVWDTDAQTWRTLTAMHTAASSSSHNWRGEVLKASARCVRADTVLSEKTQQERLKWVCGRLWDQVYPRNIAFQRADSVVMKTTSTTTGPDRHYYYYYYFLCPRHLRYQGREKKLVRKCKCWNDH